MGKKKTGAMPTSAPKQKKKMVINMTKVELAKAYQTPGFRTGKHMTAKDRPRKKDWKRQYEKEYGKEPGRFHGGGSHGDHRTGSFLWPDNAIAFRPDRAIAFRSDRAYGSSLVSAGRDRGSI